MVLTALWARWTGNPELGTPKRPIPMSGPKTSHVGTKTSVSPHCDRASRTIPLGVSTRKEMPIKGVLTIFRCVGFRQGSDSGGWEKALKGSRRSFANRARRVSRSASKWNSTTARSCRFVGYAGIKSPWASEFKHQAAIRRAIAAAAGMFGVN
jgi:hypothetical protein